MSANNSTIPQPPIWVQFAYSLVWGFGTLAQLFGYLLTLTPRSRHNPDFTLDYTVRGISILCFLFSLFLFLRYWKLRNWTASTLVNFMAVAAAFQLTLAVIVLVAFLLDS